MWGAQGPGCGPTPFRQDPGEVADHAAHVAGEGERVTDEHPEHGHHAHRDEALQHDGEEVLPSHQAAVEERQARCHHHDKSRAYENETGVTVVDHPGLLRPSSALQPHLTREPL